jgi:hypothetical protein
VKRRSDAEWIRELYASPHARIYDWRATAEVVADDLCNRLAPTHYVDYRIEGDRMTLTLEDEKGGRRERVVEPFAPDAHDAVVAAICALALPGVRPYRIALLDRSDTYAFFLLPEEDERRMRKELGAELDRLLRPLPSPIGRSAARSRPRTARSKRRP